jgi:cob(I)alamin adenosyltransferase
MKRITRITTRAGDRGQTRLADGHKVAKDSLRVEVYGTVDELNSHIGLALALEPIAEVAGPLKTIQNELFHLGADLATPAGEAERPEGPWIAARHVTALETLLRAWTDELGPLPEFILPGGSPAAAALHVARTVCRRAERLAVALNHDEAISPEALKYLNRLSDALFAMARLENLRRGLSETPWDMYA